MDLKKIKEVINSGSPDAIVRMVILDIISEDENALVDMMKILENERRKKKELILEMNMQLSRADMAIKVPDLNKDKFIEKEIAKFYQDNKHQIGHCFKNTTHD